ncbi:copper resistance protein B [Alcaligenes phenolicus]|uniref:Copper resistance protein B n=1 Tax=Alcaligenes phenolicus TaxID=232846 RepID=A0AAW5VRP8_9BURK|nr:copper resistance protein B [Alcaligenes phenolicus]MCX5565833.1 copper resistance protein B [Alcaligenes phenolicus]
MNDTLGILVMNNQLKKKFLAAAIAAAGAAPVFVYAQTHTGHTSPASQTGASAMVSGMDHGSVDMQDMNHGSMDMSGMDHGSSSSGSPAAAHDMGAMSTMDHGGGEMDHGDMQMQGGSAPPDARDPDAYSEGYVRNAGKYALPPSEALVMSDMHSFGSVYFDRLEYVKARGEEWAAYEGEAWYGSTYNRAVIKAEGEVANGKLQESETQLLWRHAVATFWDTELGVRFDYAQGAPNREWLAFGIRGTAPYWFEVDATAYVGSSGRTALGLSAEYDILLTQKLYLQPAVEMNLYGKDDEERGIGSGLTDITAGLRLKYEITRQFVPYVGVEWSSKFGKTADYARAAGEARQETRFVAGLSFRF